MLRSLLAVFILLLALAIPTYADLPLMEVLRSREDFSQFTALLESHPEIVQTMAASGGTILAPDNDAMQAFADSQPDGIQAVPPGTLRALLGYHFLTRTLDQEQLSVEGGEIVETSLRGDAFSNLGDQSNVVFGSAYGTTGLDAQESALRIYSGAGDPAGVAPSSMRFDGGLIHPIDKVLNLPQNATETARAAGLTTFVEALRRAGLAEEYDTQPLLTICAPTNEAWDDTGIDLTSLSPAELRDMLNYHVAGNVTGYTTVLGEDQNVPVLNGQTVRIIKRDGRVMVNDAQILTGNVIMRNGLTHIVSRVLLPPNSTFTTYSGSETATRTTRRTSNPSGTFSGSQPSDNTPGGSSQTLESGLFGLFGAVGAAILATL